ncbi:MAG: integration host factor subunit beta [Nitrospirae bacterium]|nr:integration host factor subunit beta [Nitrospirota bacterium]
MGSFLDFAGIFVKGISIAIEEAKKEEDRKGFNYGNQDSPTKTETSKNEVISREDLVREETKKENPRATQRETIETFIDLVKKTLMENNKFTIRGFGSFTVKDHNPRKARNPRTGEPIDVPARRSVAFKMGKDLDELVNKKDNEGDKE